MKYINFYTDSPKPNLALMRLSAWHKAQGDSISLNVPLMPCDHSYASVLFDKNIDAFQADEYGGPAFHESKLPLEINAIFNPFKIFVSFSIRSHA